MAQKYSFDRGDHNEIYFWLIFDAWGAVRITRGEPDLKASERAMYMTAKLPHKLFNRAHLRGRITVNDTEAETFTVDVETASAALKDALGIDIDLQVRPVEE